MTVARSFLIHVVASLSQSWLLSSAFSMAALTFLEASSLRPSHLADIVVLIVCALQIYSEDSWWLASSILFGPSTAGCFSAIERRKSRFCEPSTRGASHPGSPAYASSIPSSRHRHHTCMLCVRARTSMPVPKHRSQASRRFALALPPPLAAKRLCLAGISLYCAWWSNSNPGGARRNVEVNKSFTAPTLFSRPFFLLVP